MDPKEYTPVADHEESDGIFISEDPEEDDGSFVTASQSIQQQTQTTPRQTTLLPDDTIRLGNIQLAEGSFSIKFLKFFLVTYLGIVATYYVVRYMVRERSSRSFAFQLTTFIAQDWEHDHELKLSGMWRYEVNLIFMDCLVFFLVGRFYQQRGTDNLEFVAITVAASLYSSYITTFSMFQHSATLYEMHCRWPVSLWIFVVCLVPLVATIGILHIRQAVLDGILVQKCLEMLVVNLFCLVPFVTSGFFHLHHWYAGWLLGMHINFHRHRWSRWTQYWCWGCYINGIGVWGRDPVLTCAYALFMAKTQRCPFVHCYLEGLEANDTQAIVTEMKHADWRNCSDDGYHP